MTSYNKKFGATKQDEHDEPCSQPSYPNNPKKNTHTQQDSLHSIHNTKNTHHKVINLHKCSMHRHHILHTENSILKVVDIEGKVVDVIRQGGRPKGNINNRDSMEDRHKNMGVLA